MWSRYHLVLIDRTQRKRETELKILSFPPCSAAQSSCLCVPSQHTAAQSSRARTSKKKHYHAMKFYGSSTSSAQSIDFDFDY